MDLNQLFDYFQAALPLTLGHLLIPPISTYTKFQKYPGSNNIDLPPENVRFIFQLIAFIRPPFIYNEDFLMTLLLKKTKNQTLMTIFPKFPDHDLFTYRIISHLFVHYSYSHLLNNLSSFLSVGYTPYKEFGLSFYYLLFFGGGVTASLPLYRSLQVYLEERNQQRFSNTLIKVGNNNNNNSSSSLFVPMGAIEIFQSLKKTVSSLLTIDLEAYACGSSGAISAYLGSSFVITLHNTFSTLSLILRLFQVENPSSHERSLLNNASMDMLIHIWNLFYSGKFLYSEYMKFTKQQDALSSWWTSFLPSLTLIDHEAHLQGFLFGVIATGIAYWNRQRKTIGTAQSVFSATGRVLGRKIEIFIVGKISLFFLSFPFFPFSFPSCSYCSVAN